MAKRNQNQNPSEDAIEVNGDIHYRSYKAGKDSFTKFEEGDEIAGVFVSVRQKEIKDRRTKQLKMVRVYSIKNQSGVAKVTGRSLLDSGFDDIMDEHGGFNLATDNKTFIGPGIEWITNRAIKFLRGEDETTNENNPIGTYEILVEE